MRHNLCGYHLAILILRVFGILGKILGRMLPFVFVLGITTGIAMADSAGFMQFVAPVPKIDIMAPYRAFPTPRRVLAMLQFAGPVYGLDVKQVTGVRPGPNEGQDKTGIADYRYIYLKCEGSAQVHVIGGEEIEGGWRLRDIAELQHVGEQCVK